MDLQFYRDSVDQHGVGAALYHAAYRAANRVTKVAVWNALAVTLAWVATKFVSDPRRSGGRMLEAAAMRPYAKIAANRLPDSFIDAAAASGDHCYALFDGDALASYAWYSIRPTRLPEIDRSLVMRFDPSWVYMYNGFTVPTYRGRRLHAVGMTAALDAFAREGHKGVVCYVDSNNFASLKSCYRMGYSCFGHIGVMKVGKRFVCHASRGCKAFGLRVETAP
jgi:hypothetical protein